MGRRLHRAMPRRALQLGNAHRTLLQSLPDPFAFAFSFAFSISLPITNVNAHTLANTVTTPIPNIDRHAFGDSNTSDACDLAEHTATVPFQHHRRPDATDTPYGRRCAAHLHGQYRCQRLLHRARRDLSSRHL